MHNLFMNKIETAYLRKRKSTLMQKRYDIYKDAGNPLRLVSVESGIVVPPLHSVSTDSCVLDADGHLVDISVYDCEDGYIESINNGRVSVSDIPKRSGRVLYGGFFNPHWGHFVVDTLSRLWPLDGGCLNEIDRIVFTVSNGTVPTVMDNKFTALKLLGLDGMIEFVDTPVRYDCVWVPEVAVSPLERFASESLAVYDRIIASAMKIANAGSGLTRTASRKIYMSRSKLPKARKFESGLEWLDRFYRDSGYEVIYPEKTDLVSMIAILQSADEVAAISGTLPHNMLFARPGTHLDIIEKYPTINNYQQGIDLLKHLDVTLIDACAFIRPVDPGAGPFILYPTAQFKAYASDRRLAAVPAISDGFRHRAVAKFMRGYRRMYHHRWVFPQWLEEEIGLCNEAYDDTYVEFGAWLDGRHPATPADCLSPRDTAKRAVRYLKKMISKD